jgi:hypothetical protein
MTNNVQINRIRFWTDVFLKKARWQFGNIYHFDSVNEKSQERLYYEQRNRGRASGIMKQVAGSRKT